MSVNWDDVKDYHWVIENNLLKTKSFSISLNDIESFKVKRPFWSYIYEFIMMSLGLSIFSLLFNFDWKVLIGLIAMMFFYDFVLTLGISRHLKTP